MFNVATASQTDAYSLWLHVRSAVTSAHYPDRIAYRIVVSGLDGSEPWLDHYRAVADPSAGAIRVFPISDEQLQKDAPVPRGVNIGISVPGAYIPIGRPQAAQFQDLLGMPLIQPTYTFGIVYRHKTHQWTPPPSQSSLPIIATVSTERPQYQVTLLDTPQIDGALTYHLGLKPLERPKENRLREVWAGAADYLPRRVRVAGNFTIAPLDDVPWTIDYAVVDGAPYISQETALATLYLPHQRVVRGAIVAFDNIHEPDGSLYDTPLVAPEWAYAMLVEP